MIIQTTALGMPIIDTQGELWGFTVQNNDAANDVYLSTTRSGLDKSGVAVAPSQGIRIAANGGSWTVMFFKGKMYAVALNAPVNLAIETWNLHIFSKATVQPGTPASVAPANMANARRL
jgi:hypothetical protein